MTTIIGVDFSGAAAAGEKIWVSRARIENDGLHFDYLERAMNLPGGDVSRDAVFPALRKWLCAHEGAKCGFDFPFSVRRDSIEDASYAEWLTQFPERFPTAESLKESLPDNKRLTDVQAKTPFSPLNIRLYRQTYYGIREVLAPLYQEGARILPFDEAQEGKLWLMEICPASLLKRQGLYLSYKGKSQAQRDNRQFIAQEIKLRTPFTWDEKLQALAYGDTEGDALDAILSAVCVFNALKKPEQFLAADETERFEGKVYF